MKALNTYKSIYVADLHQLATNCENSEVRTLFKCEIEQSTESLSVVV